MALVQGEFYSEALGMDTQITALIPEPSALVFQAIRPAFPL